ncbi:MULTISPECIES: hypothetical protein [Chryseobacterium]|uniref:Uncharacterized protein n=1 Tax=Chryseobacterium camelliae TaxID=1265445 RepID=A0ABU0TIT6_9FLAO|nr:MULTISPECIES: hypothetical protein [Chryseobacterium]MDT3409185.1 hypothetical protein [Pseudacidovorax intermedius]MDQ1096954.1 hypothetical protein [Chryseobacterium camelliae]MDQ1100895.1 hypothetical protein [Chryseobacterium sp. SORGH_AS_1048]MDR6084338.1 hypothetical protein [Chryseobacterium sp. SORGH_AS_0909]MDR6132609.1 hypothetical protein [Chryseobacterium sp. SORGH_AS_1175]
MMREKSAGEADLRGNKNHKSYLTHENYKDKSFENRRAQKFLKTYGFYVHVKSSQFTEIQAAKFPSLGGVAKIL